MEMDALVVICAGQLEPLARDHLSLKLEFGWVKELMLVVISFEEGPTSSLGATQD